MSVCTECGKPVWHYFHAPAHIDKGTEGTHLFSIGELVVSQPEPGITRYNGPRFMLDTVIVVGMVAIAWFGLNFLNAVGDWLVVILK